MTHVKSILTHATYATHGPTSPTQTTRFSRLENTENENSSVRKTEQNRLMLLSNCAVCTNKKSTFIKNQELSND